MYSQFTSGPNIIYTVKHQQTILICFTIWNLKGHPSSNRSFSANETAYYRNTLLTQNIHSRHTVAVKQSSNHSITTWDANQSVGTIMRVPARTQPVKQLEDCPRGRTFEEIGAEIPFCTKSSLLFGRMLRSRRWIFKKYDVNVPTD